MSDVQQQEEQQQQEQEHTLVFISRIKQTLNTATDAENNTDDDKKVDASTRTEVGFFKLCRDSGVPEELTRRAWERSNRGRNLNKVSDVCWCILNCDEGTSVTKRRDRREAAASERYTSELISQTALVQYYESLFRGGDDQNGGSVFSQEEWNKFVAALSSPLPMALRCHNQGHLKAAAAALLVQQCNQQQQQQPSAQLATLVAPALRAFGCKEDEYRSSELLQDLTRTGHSGSCMSFQETVSMLPVAALGIQPHHCVLDMCAAPGSKSLQAMDALNSNSVSAIAGGSGCLLANEKNAVKARQILPARMKKYHALQSLVTCGDASKAPFLVRKTPKGGAASSSASASAAAASSEQQQQQEEEDPRFYFDRIVCDVPCSGDGTVRKDRSLLGTWTKSYAEKLAVDAQFPIARRGITQLRVGGRLAYSTCSMNPVEDEHVVLQILCTFKGTVRLVDVNEELKQQLGVMSSEKRGVLNSVGAGFVLNQQQMEAAAAKVPQIFRPTDAEELRQLAQEISRCVLRVLPHRDDTGGFFVALFEKLPGFKEITLPAPKRWQHWSNQKRFELVSPDDAEWQRLADWFGVAYSAQSATATIPRPHVIVVMTSPQLQGSTRLVPLWHVSPEGKRKKINLTTESAAALAFGAELAGGVSELVNVGARAFERMQERYMTLVEQRMRATTEGAELWGGLATKRVVTLRANPSCFSTVAAAAADVNNNNDDDDDCDKQQQKLSFVYLLMRDGTANFSETKDAASVSSPVVPPCLLVPNSDAVQSGSFLLKIIFTSAVSGDHVFWAGAMVTTMRKVDFLVDYSTRRMLMQAFAGITLPYGEESAAAVASADGAGSDDDDDVDAAGVSLLGGDDEGDALQKKSNGNKKGGGNKSKPQKNKNQNQSSAGQRRGRKGAEEVAEDDDSAAKDEDD